MLDRSNSIHHTAVATMTSPSSQLSRAILSSPSNHQPHPSFKLFPTSHAHHTFSSSYALDILTKPAQPLLLTVATPIRTLITQYLDDLSAIQYLTTCHSLHAAYHTYPLKQPLTVEAFSERCERWYTTKSLVKLVGGLSPLLLLVSLVLLPLVLLVVVCCVMVQCICDRSALRLGCCGKDDGIGANRLSRFLHSAISPVPRVLTLSGTIPSRLLPYVRHIVEAHVVNDDSAPIGPHNPLPRSLRTLRLHDSPTLHLTLDTLPHRLNTLTLGALKQHTRLTPGVLPQSLTSLHLTAHFNNRQPLTTGILPHSLLRLDLDEFYLPLSTLALPQSLTHLTLHMLQKDDTIRPGMLPPNLEVLQLSGFFDQPHPIGAGVLPSSLRVLHLMGCYSQPFTYNTFANVQQLEELRLSHHYKHPLLPGILPASLRVLCLGTLVLPIVAGTLPASLERLVIQSKAWPNVAWLVPLSVRPRSDLDIEFEMME